MEIWELPEGAVTVQEEGHIVHFRVDCVPPCEPTRLLRCYGEGAPKEIGRASCRERVYHDV